MQKLLSQLVFFHFSLSGCTYKLSSWSPPLLCASPPFLSCSSFSSHPSYLLLLLIFPPWQCETNYCCKSFLFFFFYPKCRKLWIQIINIYIYIIINYTKFTFFIYCNNIILHLNIWICTVQIQIHVPAHQTVTLFSLHKKKQQSCEAHFSSSAIQTSAHNMERLLESLLCVPVWGFAMPLINLQNFSDRLCFRSGSLFSNSFWATPPLFVSVSTHWNWHFPPESLSFIPSIAKTKLPLNYLPFKFSIW